MTRPANFYTSAPTRVSEDYGCTLLTYGDNAIDTNTTIIDLSERAGGEYYNMRFALKNRSGNGNVLRFLLAERDFVTVGADGAPDTEEPGTHYVYNDDALALSKKYTNGTTFTAYDSSASNAVLGACTFVGYGEDATGRFLKFREVVAGELSALAENDVIGGERRFVIPANQGVTIEDGEVEFISPLRGFPYLLLKGSAAATNAYLLRVG